MSKNSQKKTVHEQEGKDRHNVDARVLGQIFEMQNVIFTLPDAAHIAELFSRTLLLIPSIVACRVCLANQSIQAGELDDVLCAECDKSRRSNQLSAFVPSDWDFECRLTNRSDIRVIANDSLQHHFGFFIFRIDNEADFEVYRPFINNISNYVALTFENRLQKEQLEKAHCELELKVDERTHDLTLANANLQREIVEHKSTEIALRKSEEQVRRLINASPVAVVVSSGTEEHVELVNDKFIELFGYTIEDMPDMAHWWSLAYPDEKYREELKAQWQEKVDRGNKGKGQIEPMEAIVKCKDGSNRYIELSHSSIGEKHLVTFLDLTERIQTEHALRESEEKFRAIVEQSSEGVTLIDENGNVIEWNQANENMTGLTRNEVVGMPLWDVMMKIVPPERQMLQYCERLKAAILDVLKTDRSSVFTRSVETEFYHYRSRERRYLNQIIFPVKAEKGGRAASLSHDITERRQVEQRVQQLAAIVESSDDAVISATLDGKFLSWNKGAEKLYGYTEDELIGHTVSIIVPPERRDEISHILARMASGEHIEHFETVRRRKDGQDIFMSLAVSPIRDADGRIVAVSNIGRDISERKRHELEREAIITVSTALRQATTQIEVLNLILDQLVELFKADGATLSLPDPQTGSFIDKMGRGVIGERMIGLNIPPDKGVCNWVIENKKPYLSNHVERDPLFYRPDLLDNAHCVATVPLITQEKVIGVLWIARKHEILDEDLRLLMAISDIAASTIHRFMLHEQTERHLKHLMALHQMDLAISTNFDLNVTLNIILSTVRDELEVDAASILLMDPVTYTLNYAAGIGFKTRNIEYSRVKFGEGYAGRSAREYLTISCPDLRLEGEIFSRSLLLAEEQFVLYYVTPLVVKGQIGGVLELFHRGKLEPVPDWVSYFETLATQTAIAIESATMFDKLQRSNMDLMLAYDATIEGWSRALDLRDKETKGHTQRVTDIVLTLAEKVNMTDAEKLDLRRGALLHDIGKMGVPDAILHKPGPLTDDEWKIMRLHPVYAHQMLSSITYLKRALEVPYCHHERWDGSGYPRGLTGEEIPLSARLFAIVDVFDALVSDRPYRAAWPVDKALEYLEQQAGKQFDPEIVNIFLKITW